MLETNPSSYVEHHTRGKFQFLFLGSFLLILTKCSFWEQYWELGYNLMKFYNFSKWLLNVAHINTKIFGIRLDFLFFIYLFIYLFFLLLYIFLVLSNIHFWENCKFNGKTLPHLVNFAKNSELRFQSLSVSMYLSYVIIFMVSYAGTCPEIWIFQQLQKVLFFCYRHSLKTVILFL